MDADDANRFLKQAEICREEANKALSPIEAASWLRLAYEFEQRAKRRKSGKRRASSFVVDRVHARGWRELSRCYRGKVPTAGTNGPDPRFGGRTDLRGSAMAAERILQVAILGLFIFSIVLASMLILKWWIKAPMIIIRGSNPTALSGKGSLIFLEYMEKPPWRWLGKIARETGRLVTVQAEDNRLIDMIPPLTTHWIRRKPISWTRHLFADLAGTLAFYGSGKFQPVLGKFKPSVSVSIVLGDAGVLSTLLGLPAISFFVAFHNSTCAGAPTVPVNQQSPFPHVSIAPQDKKTARRRSL
jgi:hypothetical protein